MTLLFAGDDKVRQNRDHRAVHRHGDRDFIKRDAVEQDLHILDAINRYTRFADVTLHPGVITVVAAVRCQIKGHRHALLARSQSLAVERVAFLSCRKTRVLTDSPRAACVHRRLDPPRKRPLTGDATQMIQPLKVGLSIQRLDLDPFQRFPRQVLKGFAPQFFCRKLSPKLCAVRRVLIRHGDVLLCLSLRPGTCVRVCGCRGH